MRFNSSNAGSLGPTSVPCSTLLIVSRRISASWREEYILYGRAGEQKL